jgi:hypothetical protein
MLWTIAIVLFIIWLIFFLTKKLIGGLIHLALLIAIILIAIKVYQAIA